MSDTTLRMIEMLGLVPRFPARIAARDLHRRLLAQGFEVDVRSVERDLHKLSCQFPLVCDEARPAGWSWSRDAGGISLPMMSLPQALTLDLVRRYLEPMFPPPLLEAMQPDFHAARAALNMLAATPLGQWSNRVAVIPMGNQRLAPEVSDCVVEAVYESVLKGHQLETSYHALAADRAKQFTLNPLGLVFREGVLCLIATVSPYQDPRHFAVQRMRSAKPTSRPAQIPSGFDFKHYLETERAFDYPSGKSIRLELRVSGWLATVLSETRLSEDQCVRPIRNSEKARVTATLNQTEQLVWWLLSLGADVEVVRPLALRRRIANVATTLARRYA